MIKAIRADRICRRNSDGLRPDGMRLRVCPAPDRPRSRCPREPAPLLPTAWNADAQRNLRKPHTGYVPARPDAQPAPLTPEIRRAYTAAIPSLLQVAGRPLLYKLVGGPRRGEVRRDPPKRPCLGITP
jgi:hypothetical protein